MTKAEKLCKSAPPKVRRFVKRQVRRSRRRAERRDPESAGTALRHFTMGWTE